MMKTVKKRTLVAVNSRIVESVQRVRQGDINLKYFIFLPTKMMNYCKNTGLFEIEQMIYAEINNNP